MLTIFFFGIKMVEKNYQFLLLFDETAETFLFEVMYMLTHTQML